MNAIILDNTPVSGSLPEYYFGESYLNSLWVKFDDDESEWVGCFPNSYKVTLVPFADTKTVLIVMDHTAYYIDIAARKLLHYIDESAICSSIATTQPNYILISGFYKIYVFDNKGLYGEYPVSFWVEKIVLQQQDSAFVKGMLYGYQDSWVDVPFKFNLNTFDYEIDKKVIIKNWGPVGVTRVVDKDYVKKGGWFAKLTSKLFK